MGDWPNYGGNSDISGLFEENQSTQCDVQEEQPIETEYDEPEINYPVSEVKKVKRGRKPKNEEEDPLTEYRSAKYTESQIQKLKMIKEALSTTNDGEALRWALDAAYKANKRKIERIVEEKQRIESL